MKKRRKIYDGPLPNTEALSMGLLTLKNVEEALMMNDPCGAEPGKKYAPDQITRYSFALMIEIAELVQLLNWKSWKPPKELDRDRVVDEFADILAFLGIIIDMLNREGISPFDLARGFEEKTKVNHRRLTGQVEEYKMK